MQLADVSADDNERVNKEVDYVLYQMWQLHGRGRKDLFGV